MPVKKMKDCDDALLDPLFREQMQALADMTAAIEGRPSKKVVLSVDEDSVLNHKPEPALDQG